jgi:hypothetical protein
MDKAGEGNGGRRVCRRTDPNFTRKEGETAMHVKTNVKSGAMNHNETLVREAGQGKGPRAKAPGLKVKTGIKAGDPVEPLDGIANHNETLVRAAGQAKAPRAKARGLRVKTHVKAGATGIDNHNETLVR